jgi:hypothetical protein
MSAFGLRGCQDAPLEQSETPAFLSYSAPDGFRNGRYGMLSRPALFTLVRDPFRPGWELRSESKRSVGTASEAPSEGRFGRHRSMP